MSDDKKPDRIPGRMHVEQQGQHQQWLFRCDDRNGFMLSILLAGDGDLHLSIVPDPDHEDRLNKCHYVSGSIRLRMPMIGGGMYEHLYPALKKSMYAELKKEKRRYPVKEDAQLITEERNSILSGVGYDGPNPPQPGPYCITVEHESEKPSIGAWSGESWSYWISENEPPKWDEVAFRNDRVTRWWDPCATAATPAPVVDETTKERIHDIIENRIMARLDAYEEKGILLPYCDDHDRDHIASDEKDGHEFCHECAADGASGELVNLGTDSEAIDLAEQITKDILAVLGQQVSP